MKKPIVVLGIGELGSVFARAFLKNNYPVYPITKETDINELAHNIDPELILICTGEADLQNALKDIPDKWKNRVAMMQNELLPRDWEDHDLLIQRLFLYGLKRKKAWILRC